MLSAGARRCCSDYGSDLVSAVLSSRRRRGGTAQRQPHSRTMLTGRKSMRTPGRTGRVERRQRPKPNSSARPGPDEPSAPQLEESAAQRKPHSGEGCTQRRAQTAGRGHWEEGAQTAGQAGQLRTGLSEVSEPSAPQREESRERGLPHFHIKAGHGPRPGLDPGESTRCSQSFPWFTITQRSEVHLSVPALRLVPSLSVAVQCLAVSLQAFT